jgi:hypothetical protein
MRILLLDIVELKLWITSAAEAIDRNVFKGAWGKLSFRLDIGRYTNEAQIGIFKIRESFIVSYSNGNSESFTVLMLSKKIKLYKTTPCMRKPENSSGP